MVALLVAEVVDSAYPLMQQATVPKAQYTFAMPPCMPA